MADPSSGRDTPITVVGSPMGESPAPHCAQAGWRIFFGPDDVKLAWTDVRDAEGRRELLVRTMLYQQYGSSTPEPSNFIDDSVTVFDLRPPEEKVGWTATWNGCVFFKAYVPEEAIGGIIRLNSAIKICAAETPEWNQDGDAVVASALVLGEPGSATAKQDIVIPEKTELSALDPCIPAGTWPPWQWGWDQYLLEQAIIKAGERDCSDDSGKKAGMLQRAGTACP